MPHEQGCACGLHDWCKGRKDPTAPHDKNLERGRRRSRNECLRCSNFNHVLYQKTAKGRAVVRRFIARVAAHRRALGLCREGDGKPIAYELSKVYCEHHHWEGARRSMERLEHA